MKGKKERVVIRLIDGVVHPYEVTDPYVEIEQGTLMVRDGEKGVAIVVPLNRLDIFTRKDID